MTHADSTFLLTTRNAAALPQYVKAFARKGQALQGLGRHREAAATFEAGLQVDTPPSRC